MPRFGVVEIPGSRLRFQFESMRELWRHVSVCDLILSQEVLRGSLNANLIGLLRRKPVVTYLCTSPVEYFRCRRERRQIGPVMWWLGSTAHSHARDHQRPTRPLAALRWDRTFVRSRPVGARGARSG